MGGVADCLRFFLKLLNLPIKMLKTLLELTKYSLLQIRSMFPWSTGICVKSQTRQQTSGRDLYVFTVELLALKKLFFSFFLGRNIMFLIFFYIFYYATIQCGRYGIFKKNLKYFFDPEKLKKPLKKVAHNVAQTLLLHSPAQANGPQPKIDFPYYEILGPEICSLYLCF